MNYETLVCFTSIEYLFLFDDQMKFLVFSLNFLLNLYLECQVDEISNAKLFYASLD